MLVSIAVITATGFFCVQLGSLFRRGEKGERGKREKRGRKKKEQILKKEKESKSVERSRQNCRIAFFVLFSPNMQHFSLWQKREELFYSNCFAYQMLPKCKRKKERVDESEREREKKNAIEKVG